MPIGSIGQRNLITEELEPSVTDEREDHRPIYHRSSCSSKVILSIGTFLRKSQLCNDISQTEKRTSHDGIGLLWVRFQQSLVDTQDLAHDSLITVIVW